MAKRRVHQRTVQKALTVILIMTMCAGLFSGCGSKDKVTEEQTIAAESVTIADDVLPTGTTDAEEAADNKADTKAAAIYFDKGVYQNYPPDDVNASLDYFYVFYDGGAGYTENAATGMGLPFACEQSEGSVRFSFGGEGDGWDVFTVETVENKAVIGHFGDGKRLAFVYVPDADPDNFNAAEYMYGSSHEEE